MAPLTPATVGDVQRAIRDAGLDGWLLYDFRNSNPIALHLAGIDSRLSRRICVFVPREGVPVALSHNIEQSQWHAWPSVWPRKRYSAWKELEAHIKEMVAGKRIAMEYSPGGAVPYLDRVPAGVLEMIRGFGADVVTSSELASMFYARWTEADMAAHRRSAETIAGLAQDAFRFAADALKAGRPVYEHELQARLLAGFAAAGLEAYAPPNVSFGVNAANPHYEPSAEHPQQIVPGHALLIDLWAREPGTPYADQTWMAFVGEPTARAQEVWSAIRDARDAAIQLLRERGGSADGLRGADVDDAARRVIESRGFGPQFTHRTGHNIDARDIHGAGPNIDNLETRDIRFLVPGVGFSIEPGVYFEGEIGMRTEVNAFMTTAGVVVTPEIYQRELIII